MRTPDELKAMVANATVTHADHYDFYDKTLGWIGNVMVTQDGQYLGVPMGVGNENVEPLLCARVREIRGGESQ